MKTTLAAFAACILSVSAFAPVAPAPRINMALADVPLANGSMSFNRVCREWRCKYEGDKGSSESLEAIAKVVRLVCGSCKDFKLMTTVPLEDFGPWEENGHAPEKDFLEKIKAIPGVSQVETQTITNME